MTLYVGIDNYVFVLVKCVFIKFRHFFIRTIVYKYFIFKLVLYLFFYVYVFFNLFKISPRLFFTCEDLIVSRKWVKILVSLKASLCEALPISDMIGLIGMSDLCILVIRKVWDFSGGVRRVLARN